MAECSNGWAERCRTSHGKRCRCACGGENHGTGARRVTAGDPAQIAITFHPRSDSMTAVSRQDVEAMARDAYPTLLNRAMARKLVKGEAIDVAQFGATTVPGATLYPLPEFVDGMDYCDTEYGPFQADGRGEHLAGTTLTHGAWIWSIGKAKDGTIVASTDSRFYGNPEYECLFLR